MLTIKEAQGNFFDRARVLQAVGQASRGALSRFGAFVRTRAITLLLGHRVRKSFGAKSQVSNRQGISAPGDPPFAHVGLIPRFLFFAYDPTRQSVVIGPVRVGGLSGQALPALEYGGTSDIWDAQKRARVRANIRARPFMGPAYRAELPGAPELWRNSVR
jgi:hypothetical protein